MKNLANRVMSSGPSQPISISEAGPSFTENQQEGSNKDMIVKNRKRQYPFTDS